MRLICTSVCVLQLQLQGSAQIFIVYIYSYAYINMVRSMFAQASTISGLVVGGFTNKATEKAAKISLFNL